MDACYNEHMKAYVLDPTAQDQKSKVRGIGRYLQILRENFKDEFEFISPTGHRKLGFGFWDLGIENSVFVNPFLNLLQPPLSLFRIAKKQIAVIHDLIPLKYPAHFPAGLKGRLNIFLNMLALRHYDVIVTDSEASKRDIINILNVDQSRIKVVYPCLSHIFTHVKLKKFHLKSNSNDKTYSKSNIESLDLNSNLKLKTKNYVIYVGDATWNKNLVHIARAIKLGDVPCVFVGSVFAKAKGVDSSIWHARQPTRENICAQAVHAWQNELREFLSLAKDDKRFIFPGFIPDEELITLYEHASLNILLSRDEGFGFSYVEASTFGCPSLLSDRPIFHEIAGTAAEFADPENVQEIAGAIKGCTSPEKRKRLGSEAQKQAKIYSQQRFKEAFLTAVS